MVVCLRTALICLFALLAATPSLAQRLAGTITERQVAIDSTFSGETLTLFGNIEPERGEADQPVEGPFEVVVVVTGPALDRMAWRKTNDFVIWLNTQNVLFLNFPSFKWVLSSGRLENIASDEVLLQNHILPNSFGHNVIPIGDGDRDRFKNELVRLMTEKGLFGVNEVGVNFQSRTLYSARIALPGDVPNGTFLAETYLFKGGEVVARKAESFIVRKAGFERLLGDAARNSPFLYGLACVVLAVFTGWLGGVAFRR